MVVVIRGPTRRYPGIPDTVSGTIEPDQTVPHSPDIYPAVSFVASFPLFSLLSFHFPVSV